MNSGRILLAVLLLGVCVLPARTARAQTNDDVNAGIQFNFSTPGARSLALGGAFLGLSDDATAAYTNPAGLTNLTVGGSELTVELRQWGYTNIFPDHGRIGGSPSGIGIDTISGVQDGEVDSQTEDISFLSFGYVLPRGWTLALYRHQLANFEARAVSQGFLVGASPGARVFPSESRLNLQILNYGFAVGYRLRNSLGAGSLSLGLGASYYQSRILSRTDRFSRRDWTGRDELDRQPGGFYGPADGLGDNINNTILQAGEDSDWGYNLGFLWSLEKSQHWSVGAVFRRGPSLASDTRYIRGPVLLRNNPQGSENTDLGGRVVLRVPDVLGVGVAWSPAEEGKVRLALDYDRVRYSQMIGGLTNVLLQERGVFQRSNYRIRDADEIHLGLEYVFLVIEPRLVCTARFGGWHDPAHTLEYVGSNSALAVRFRPGEDQNHVSAGLGLVVGENFQADIAYDHSKRVRTLSFSLVKFF